MNNGRARARTCIATPSGDRLFVALAGEEQLQASSIDSRRDVVGKVKLPGEARGLRMDPLGRVVLVRGPADTVWVVGVATATKLLGTVQIRVARRFAAGVTGRTDRDSASGAERCHCEQRDVYAVRAHRLQNGRSKDFWEVLRWNGFRRACCLASMSQCVFAPARAPRETAPVASDRATAAATDSRRTNRECWCSVRPRDSVAHGEFRAIQLLDRRYSRCSLRPC